MIDPITVAGAVMVFTFGAFAGELWQHSKARRHPICPTCLSPTDETGTVEREE